MQSKATTALHEDYGRKSLVKQASDRRFGIVFAVFFGVIAVLPLRTGASPRWWAVAVSAVVLATAILHPRLLHRANTLWGQLGLAIGGVVNPIVTAIFYFVVFAPVGVFMRLTSKDPLRLRRDASASTYWIPRDRTANHEENMLNQF